MVDYVLATQNRVYEGILSDDCFISFGLSMVLQVREKNISNEENTFPLEYRYIWSTEWSECYTREVNAGSFITIFTNYWTIGRMRQSMTDNLFETVCGPLFKKSHHGNSVFSSYASPHLKSDNKWYNDECRDARDEIHRCLNLFRNDKTEINCKKYDKGKINF